MTAHFKVDRWIRLMLSSVWVITLMACSTGENSDTPDGLVTSNGFVCPQPEPRIEFESETIYIYTWTEYMPVDIIECFGLVYDVNVVVDYFSSNEELYSKVSLGSGSTLYDVVHPSDYMIGVLIREGLLQELDYSKIPNLLNLDSNLTVPYGTSTKYLVPYQMGTQGILYNSRTVDTPPTSWADLWNPEYEGRIVAVDDNRVVIGAALLTLGYSVNDTAPDHLEEAKEKLIELMPNILAFDSDSPSDLLLAGDADLGILWNGEAFLAQAEESQFKYVFPEEGSIIFYDGMAIPTTALHSDAAYAWFNYLLQGNVNWLALVDYPYTNPNKAALEYAKEHQPAVYEAYISSPITNTPTVELEKGHEVLDLGAALLLYDELWMEVNP